MYKIIFVLLIVLSIPAYAQKEGDRRIVKYANQIGDTVCHLEEYVYDGMPTCRWYKITDGDGWHGKPLAWGTIKEVNKWLRQKTYKDSVNAVNESRRVMKIIEVVNVR
jgi:hypothetical protein